MEEIKFYLRFILGFAIWEGIVAKQMKQCVSDGSYSDIVCPLMLAAMGIVLISFVVILGKKISAREEND